eukprot:1919355-Amphidinium_carterae.1
MFLQTFGIWEGVGLILVSVLFTHHAWEGRGETTVKMTRMRQAIARRLKDAKPIKHFLRRLFKTKKGLCPSVVPQFEMVRHVSCAFAISHRKYWLSQINKYDSVRDCVWILVRMLRTPQQC